MNVILKKEDIDCNYHKFLLKFKNKTLLRNYKSFETIYLSKNRKIIFYSFEVFLLYVAIVISNELDLDLPRNYFLLLFIWIFFAISFLLSLISIKKCYDIAGKIVNFF